MQTIAPRVAPSSKTVSLECQRPKVRTLADHLRGLIVRICLDNGRPGFDSRLRRGSFSRSGHTSDFKIGTPVATLPGTWRHRVSAGTGWTGVSIL